MTPVTNRCLTFDHNKAWPFSPCNLVMVLEPISTMDLSQRMQRDIFVKQNEVKKMHLDGQQGCDAKADRHILLHQAAVWVTVSKFRKGHGNIINCHVQDRPQDLWAPWIVTTLCWDIHQQAQHQQDDVKSKNETFHPQLLEDETTHQPLKDCP